MIDAHCHADRLSDAVRQAARDAGIRRMILAGVDPGGWADQAALCAVERDCVRTIGWHPWSVAAAAPESVDGGLEAVAAALEARDSTVVGVGELGLDHLPRHPRSTWPRQERAMRAQLEMAKAHDLPIVLHIVRAHDDAMRIVRDVGLPAAGGMLHAFSGSADTAKSWLKLGVHLSFGGPVTWPEARRVHAALRVVPADRLLLETDAPDQCPEPARSAARDRDMPAIGAPAMCFDVLNAAAACRSEDAHRLGACVSENARRLFRLPLG